MWRPNMFRSEDSLNRLLAAKAAQMKYIAILESTQQDNHKFAMPSASFAIAERILPSRAEFAELVWNKLN